MLGRSTDQAVVTYVWESLLNFVLLLVIVDSKYRLWIKITSSCYIRSNLWSYSDWVFVADHMVISTQTERYIDGEEIDWDQRIGQTFIFV